MDYKILTKALAHKLQKVLPSIIDTDQVGYLKKRFIGENVRIIFDIIKYAHITQQESYIIQIDYEKAFDSIEWNFLIDTLKAFNFGEKFIDWVKILYTDIKACVGNNGEYSEYFKLSRSIRQGCPISALLFIMVAEVIAIKIRSNKDIKGIKINDTILKIILMADDTTLFTADLKSLETSLKEFIKFEKCSGLKLNMGKTEVIPIGRIHNKTDKNDNNLSQLKFSKLPFKALGVWYSNDEAETTHLNVTHRIEKMYVTLNMWRMRKLSLRGKITILKTIILPQIQFLFALIYIPPLILKKIDDMMFSFLWDNKPPKIKRGTIIAPINKGGLKMIDTYAVHSSSKIAWIKRFYNTNNSRWKGTFEYMIATPKNILTRNFDPCYITRCKTKYHKQILECWKTLIQEYPYTVDHILDQRLCHNYHIQIGNKVLSNHYVKNMETKDPKIKEIVNNNGSLKKLSEARNVIDKTLSAYKYNALKLAIPNCWKKALTAIPSIENNISSISNNCLPYLCINDSLKAIHTIKNKNIYYQLIERGLKMPTAIERWIDLFPFLHNIEWKHVFELTTLITKEPYLQSFHYKILTRIVNCNEKLFQWKISDSSKCNFCNKTDTLEHHLFECEYSESLWKQLSFWLMENINITHKFTICEAILGIPFKRSNIDRDTTMILNYTGLILKWYINNQRSKKEKLYFFEYLFVLRNKLTVLTYKGEDQDPQDESSPEDWKEKLIIQL